ncbi:NHLP leader peptide family RiPP precursor [Zobellia sp. B3R18]|uniref:NHLP leader peptide family RiPP precursor n=1 Tax=Zobellia sp. B3R18 TaxID=2841568 RepID=UPI001C07B7FC|nr:NHLP leader peptide family RiPP precursor [Zobellia sp. B3R18]MBU2974972.1 NHLP leader peptide family RiPP precursor [Zobellia sp. B3R18]
MKLTEEQKLLETLISRAWEDIDFKKELIENPVKVLEQLLGRPVNLPRDKSIVVLDQTDTSVIYINIPPKIDMDDMELDEEQMEIVAGGSVLTTPVLRGL